MFWNNVKTLLDIRNLTQKELSALSDINLHIKENEFVCIIGRNGSGKSTFSKLLSGLTKFKSGKITVNRFRII
jgi:ABC-type polysaccharide/polyol phosphate transport system ATPase subunit